MRPLCLTSRRNRTVVCVTTLVLLCAIGTTVAPAARAPTNPERKAIVRAVERSPLISLPSTSYKVRGVRIATVPRYRRYGRVVLLRTDAAGDNAVGLVRRRNGRWRLINLGTSGVGCDLPAAVRADLRFGCP